jgi:hypothetical protein
VECGSDPDPFASRRLADLTLRGDELGVFD